MTSKEEPSEAELQDDHRRRVAAELAKVDTDLAGLHQRRDQLNAELRAAGGHAGDSRRTAIGRRVWWFAAAAVLAGLCAIIAVVVGWTLGEQFFSRPPDKPRDVAAAAPPSSAPSSPGHPPANVPPAVPPPVAPSGKSAGPGWSLSRAQPSKRPAAPHKAIPARPGDRELHVVGFYEGTSIDDRSRLGQNAAEVVVDRPNAAVTLCLCAYRPINWEVKINKGSQVQKVILGG
jgi:hypothetical protein